MEIQTAKGQPTENKLIVFADDGLPQELADVFKYEEIPVVEATDPDMHAETVAKLFRLDKAAQIEPWAAR